MLDKTQKFAELKIDEKSIKVPVSKGTLGPDVLDIRSLYKETGLFTYDPGFTSTASCDSNITFIDGSCKEFIHPTLLSNMTTHKQKKDDKMKYRPGALSLKHMKQLQKEGMTLTIPKFSFEQHVRGVLRVMFPDNDIKVSKSVFTILQHFVMDCLQL